MNLKIFKIFNGKSPGQTPIAAALGLPPAGETGYAGAGKDTGSLRESERQAAIAANPDANPYETTKPTTCNAPAILFGGFGKAARDRAKELGFDGLGFVGLTPEGDGFLRLGEPQRYLERVTLGSSIVSEQVLDLIFRESKIDPLTDVDIADLARIGVHAQAAFAKINANGFTIEHKRRVIDEDRANAHTTNFRNLEANPDAVHAVIKGRIRVLSAEFYGICAQTKPHVATIIQNTTDACGIALIKRLDHEIKDAANLGIEFQPSRLLATIWKATEYADEQKESWGRSDGSTYRMQLFGLVGRLIDSHNSKK